jgi:hypothetical protein
MAKTKWPPKQDGRPFENQTFAPRFQMVASLHRFIKKRVMNKIFFIPKRSRLAEKKVRSGFQMVKTKLQPFENRTKILYKKYHLNTGRLRFPDIDCSSEFEWSFKFLTRN